MKYPSDSLRDHLTLLSNYFIVLQGNHDANTLQDKFQLSDIKLAFDKGLDFFHQTHLLTALDPVDPIVRLNWLRCFRELGLYLAKFKDSRDIREHFLNLQGLALKYGVRQIAVECQGVIEKNDQQSERQSAIRDQQNVDDQEMRVTEAEEVQISSEVRGNPKMLCEFGKNLIFERKCKNSLKNFNREASKCYK